MPGNTSVSMPGNTSVRKNADQVSRYAATFSAMETEVRLQVMQLLLSAHPEDLVVGEVQKELRHSSFDPFSSVGEAEEPGLCVGAAREYVLTVHRQYRCSSRIVAVPLREVRYAK